MKFSVAAIVGLLAGCASAMSTDAVQGTPSKVYMPAKNIPAAPSMSKFNMTLFKSPEVNVKAAAAQVTSNGVVEQQIAGTPAQVNNFVNTLSLATIQQIEGGQYGAPFVIYFYDINSGNYLGYVSGYFDYNGSLQFDQTSQLPSGSSLPSYGAANAGLSSNTVQPITVTANPTISASIIQTGQISSSQLSSLLGSNYGSGPYRVILTGSNGQQIGYIGGSFNINGPFTDPSYTSIPSSSSGNGSGSGNNGNGSGNGSGNGNASNQPTVVRASGNISSQIVQAGQITPQQIQTLLGPSYGQGPFIIVLTDPYGNQIGYISGGFKNGQPVIDPPNTYIPQPNQSSPVPTPTPTPTAQPTPSSSTSSAPGDNVPGANHGSVSFNTSNPDQLKQQLDNLSYDYIKNATGGKYGPFYITFTSADGSIKGYIKGNITPNNYTYTWDYSYTGDE